MAVVLVEGFDHMIASLVNAKGWSLNPTSMQTGRFTNSQAARLAAGTMGKQLPAPLTELYVGFAHQPTVLNGSNDILVLTTAGAVNAFRLRSVVSGSNWVLQIVNSAGTVIATGTTTLANNAWHFIEIHCLINGASGSCSLRLDGIAGEIADTTGNFGSTAIASIGFVGANTANIDDVYVVDTSGPAPRDSFLGDCRVEPLFPSADGAHTQWTPSSGTAHFSRVNEKAGTFPDGDTSYVSDATPGDIDTYAFDDLSIASGTVFAVQTNLYARKDDAGTRQIADVIRQGGSDTVGDTKTLGATYAFFSQIHNQDPTGSGWTISNVNADEFGQKVIS